MALRPRKPVFPGGIARREEPSLEDDLRRRIRGAPPREPLPLVHVTAAWTANEIIRGGRLQARHCEIFGADLVYFFALRPDYRCRLGDKKSDQLTRFPVALILDPAAVPTPNHVYPFDTGAAARGFFEGAADPYVRLEDYELDPDHASVHGLIDWSFGNPAAYYEGDLRREARASIQGFESVSKGYVDIAGMGRPRADANTEVDSRATAIEVTASHDVPLLGMIRLAIVPRQFLQGNTRLIADFAALGAATEVYDWKPNTTPDGNLHHLQDIARRWLVDNGLI